MQFFPELLAIDGGQGNERQAKLVEVSAADYYGANYQDITTRVPSVRKAKECLGWTPTTDFATGLAKTLDFYLSGRPLPEV